jgi:hypothetical protein
MEDCIIQIKKTSPYQEWMNHQSNRSPKDSCIILENHMMPLQNKQSKQTVVAMVEMNYNSRNAGLG